MYCRGNPIKYSDPSGYNDKDIFKYFKPNPSGAWENPLVPSNLPADPGAQETKGKMNRLANPPLPPDEQYDKQLSKDEIWRRPNRRLDPNKIYAPSENYVKESTPPESNTPPVNNDNFRQESRRNIEFVEKILPFLKKSPGGAMFYYIFKSNTKPAY